MLDIPNIVNPQPYEGVQDYNADAAHGEVREEDNSAALGGSIEQVHEQEQSKEG